MVKEFVITKGKLTKYNGEGGHLVIPESVNEIAYGLFAHNDTLLSVEIPGSVKKIYGGQKNATFEGCKNLERVVLHEGVEEIEMSVFYDCEKLKEIVIPSTVKKIGSYAFGNTRWQHEQGKIVMANGILLRWYGEEACAVIPDGVRAIGASAFECNETLEEVYIPDSVTRIDRWAFYQCKKLEKVGLPKYLASVGESAFEYTPWIDKCEPLTIHIPEGTETIERDSFEGLSYRRRKELARYEAQDTGSHCRQILGPQIERIILPKSIRKIDAWAFKGCTIEAIELNDGLEKIEQYAFYQCDKLDDVVLPESVVEVEKEAFMYCDSQLIVRAGDKVFAALDREIRDRTVEKWLTGKLECTPAQEKPMRKYVGRTRDAWVKKIKGDRAEMLTEILSCGKPKLEQVEAYIEMVNDGKHPQMLAVLLEYKQKNFAQEQIELAEDQKIGFVERTAKDWEMLYRLKKDENGYILVKYKGIDKHPEIPSEIEGTPVYEIAKNAFKDNVSIEEIDIPGTIQTIGDSAFEKCSQLKIIRFSEGLKHIGKRTFYHCESLEGEMILPEGLLTNGVNAFDFGSNEKIKALHIPSTMEAFTGSLGLDAYYDLYIYGLYTQVDYYLIREPRTIYARKYSEAGKLLEAYAKADGYCEGTLKYIDEGMFPTNVK